MIFEALKLKALIKRVRHKKNLSTGVDFELQKVPDKTEIDVELGVLLTG